MDDNTATPYLVEYHNCSVLYCSRGCLFAGEAGEPLTVRGLPDGARALSDAEVAEYVGTFEGRNKCFHCGNQVLHAADGAD